VSSSVFAIVTARDEADRIRATLEALARAFPGAPVFVADDGSVDGTAELAERTGAIVVRVEHALGKGGAATLAARRALEHLATSREGSGAEVSVGAVDVTGRPAEVGEAVAVLCDGDLGESAGRLGALVEAVRQGEADLAVAVFAKRVGGGVGLVVGFARWALRRSCGIEMRAPISGQRAMRAAVLKDVLPFASGFGMELGTTIDATRAGHRVVELELELEHRATGRTPAGFAHRARQLADCLRAYLARR
jgi:glycosyltransferase involved in cell wall biosynthesis